MINCLCKRQYNFNYMIARYPCLEHDNRQIIKVCTENLCKECKLLCQQCMKSNRNHDIHDKIDFADFLKTWEQVENLNTETRELIRKALYEMRDKINLYLKSVEAKILDQMDCYVEESQRIKFQGLQIQQIYGLTDEKIKDKSIRQILRQEREIQEFIENRKDQQKQILGHISDFEGDILIQMNNLLNKIKKKSIIKKKVAENSKFDGNFTFSEKLKCKSLKVSSNGKIITRATPYNNGFTVYGLVEQPLTENHPQITFKIENQVDRFMYMGVCLPEQFIKLHFEGRVYQMGRHMYAIRQHELQGVSAVSLHHSLKEYSNKPAVGWDFREGDEVKLKINYEEQKLVFLWNHSVVFEMPLTSKSKQYFPFVGIKFQGGQIAIVEKKKSGKLPFLQKY